jgi:hypothetical protein
MSLAGLLRATRHVGIEGLKTAVDGKKIAVIGNASGIFGKNLGQEIDDNDVVIRFNRGMVQVAKDQGVRTDIVGTGRPLSEKEILSGYNTRKLMWLSYRWWRIPTWTSEIWRMTEVIPLPLLRDAHEKLGIRPTSGFVMLNLLLQHSKPAHVTLYGFDFYNSPNFYRGVVSNKISDHSPEMEKEFIHRVLKLRDDVSLK